MDGQLKSVLILISCALTHSSSSNLFYKDCCELKLMDSYLQVAIESNRHLPVGNFTSIKARFCTTGTIFIQLWKKTNETGFEFEWQTEFNATAIDTEKAYTLLSFDKPVAITANHRLGVYSPSNNSLKFSIPYDFDESGSMVFSSQRFDDSSMFVNGYSIEFEDLLWPRSFAQQLTFCPTASDCMGMTSEIALHTESTTNNPFSGYIPSYCCNSMVSCDIGNTVKDGLTNQNSEMINLRNTVDILRNTLENLFNSQYITGTCPDGFTAGTYGVGSCYIIHRERLQMGQAVLRCRDLYSAKLLSIQSQQEDNFVMSFVLNSSLDDTERFWTSGMYNTELRNWFWYDDDLVTKMPFGSFRNWKDGQELAATTMYDVCSVFTVNRPNKLDFWEKAICTDLNFFICEFPKQCF